MAWLMPLKQDFSILRVCGYIGVANASHVFACHSSYTSVCVCLIVIKAVLWVLIRVHQSAAMFRLTHNPSAYDFTQWQVSVYWGTSAHVYLHSDCAHHSQKHSDCRLYVRVRKERKHLVCALNGACCVWAFSGIKKWYCGWLRLQLLTAMAQNTYWHK